MNDICKLWKWYWNSDYEFIWEDIYETPGDPKSGLVDRKVVKRNSTGRALHWFLPACFCCFILMPCLALFLYATGIITSTHIANTNWVKGFTNFAVVCFIGVIVIPACIYVWNEIQNLVENKD
jgi:hypothetical protein